MIGQTYQGLGGGKGVNVGAGPVGVVAAPFCTFVPRPPAGAAGAGIIITPPSHKFWNQFMILVLSFGSVHTPSHVGLGLPAR